MSTILIATANRGKAKEIQEIFNSRGQAFRKAIEVLKKID